MIIRTRQPHTRSLSARCWATIAIDHFPGASGVIARLAGTPSRIARIAAGVSRNTCIGSRSPSRPSRAFVYSPASSEDRAAGFEKIDMPHSALRAPPPTAHAPEGRGRDELQAQDVRGQDLPEPRAPSPESRVEPL